MIRVLLQQETLELALPLFKIQTIIVGHEKNEILDL